MHTCLLRATHKSFSLFVKLIRATYEWYIFFVAFVSETDCSKTFIVSEEIDGRKHFSGISFMGKLIATTLQWYHLLQGK